MRLIVVPASPPIIYGVLNAASDQDSAISPGENILIYGDRLGPLQAQQAQPNGDVLPTVAGGVEVRIGGIAAPIYSAWASTLGVMVPYEIANQSNVPITVTYNGVLSDFVVYPVAAAVPAIYTPNNPGTGQGLILNQDGHTLNSAASPAARGSTVTLYLTGEGQTNPASRTGAFAPVDGSGLFKPALPVSATVAGMQAIVEYCGSAPGMVYGIAQVNVTIPAGAPSGNQPIVIFVGGAATQVGVTVAVM